MKKALSQSRRLSATLLVAAGLALVGSIAHASELDSGLVRLDGSSARKVDAFTDGAHVNDARDAFAQGARVGDSRNPYLDGARVGDKRDAFTEGA